MTENITRHSNAIQRLIRLLTPEESINPGVYYPFVSLLGELARAMSKDVKEVMVTLSANIISYDDYEKLATLIEKEEVACDEKIKQLVINRLRGLRNKQDQVANV